MRKYFRNLVPYQIQILAIAIGILCVGNIITKAETGNYLSILNSIIGIIGAGLLLSDKDASHYFIRAWIFAQAIIITHLFPQLMANFIVRESVFDLSQIFHLNIGFNFSSHQSAYGINFNLLIILMVIRYRAIWCIPKIGQVFKV